jgi:hypothetical protein
MHRVSQHHCPVKSIGVIGLFAAVRLMFASTFAISRNASSSS